MYALSRGCYADVCLLRRIVGILSGVHDEAARDADRYARRGEWDEAEIHCAQAIALATDRRTAEPDEVTHITSLAELHYFYAEILKNLNRLAEAVAAARTGLDLFRAVLLLDPVHVADRARDAESRLGLLELAASDDRVPYADRVAAARKLAAEDPGPRHDLNLARQIARQALDQAGTKTLDLPLLVEAVTIYRRLRPLGEDDLDLFGRIARHAAEALMNRHSYAEAVECAADAGQAFGALAVRRPERYERMWYEARELAARGRSRLEGAVS
jgi:tetratricopeptide (TPR) repeat protein